ncbi:sodium:solute symporter family protein [Caldimonas tepidiphila]|uniref:sodium:solute symporter family protein n=1 Tax=Caldimonas tepidiphila TaxID=2315841 RepID=UPI000E5BD0D3|nr:sodium:solute symporter family protein [Caldimonas tepidiphila]
MDSTLFIFVALYLLGTLAVGAWAGTRVKNTTDFAVAGRSLPLIMVVTTTFATWFGAETVMGIPARFVEGGLGAVVEDPFGASMCLVLVGVFFAARLYRMNLITIGDFYRQRFGKGVEIFCSVAIILSYLGWVAAQITALGLVFSILSGGAMSPVTGMVVGTVAVLTYVMLGGMLAVAWTDFIQMIVLVVGLSVIAVMAADLAGGADKVLAYAQANDWTHFFPAPDLNAWLFFVAAAITMMFGSIPQQDVFQRVMSAKDEKSASRGAVIGGLAYLAFAFIPMFIIVAALIVMPEAKGMLADDPQHILPNLILQHMPLVAQIFFFGALLSAIMSTSSATLLAPSTSFVENILRNIRPGMSDRQVLLALRVSLLVFTASVLVYAIVMQGTSIYELVSAAYQVPLCGAFVPLVAGVYWKRATTQGAVLSIVLGLGTWLSSLLLGWGEVFPGQLAGVLMAVAGMAIGSLAPQLLANRTEMQHHLA